MKIDTSDYYPESPLGEEREEDQECESAPENDPGPDVPETEGEHLVSVAATAVSWILVPLLMPVYGILLIFGLSVLSCIPTAPKVSFTLIVALVNVGVPALLVLMLKRMGIVEDVGLNGRRERLLPYIITIMCMCGTGWLLWNKQFPMWAVMFFVAGGAAGAVEAVVNLWWKISAHAAGIAGLVALLIRLQHEPFVSPHLFVWLLIVTGCAGLVGSSRLWLRRHTLCQVLAGYAVGFCAVYFLTAIR